MFEEKEFEKRIQENCRIQVFDVENNEGYERVFILEWGMGYGN